MGAAGMLPMPQNDPARLQQLRVQDGRPRQASPNLLAVLGGPGIQPGREQEGMAIWQSLRTRSQQGDVAASEDMATLVLLLSQAPFVQQQPQLSRALTESTYDAAVLPRHKIEQLGRLVRLAASTNDRAGAQQWLSLMMPNAPEIDADSEYRVSSAVAATLDRDPNRVLALLGPQKDAVPIVDSMDPMASVFRANAYEMLGNVPLASQILRELPDASMLDLVRARFPQMNVCAQSGAAYTSAAAQQGAQRAAASAGGITTLFGAIFAVIGLFMLATGVVVTVTVDWTAGLAPGLIGLAFFAIGLVVFVRGRAKGKRAAWLRVNGLPLQARIVDAGMTGTRINEIPVYQFVLQVAGPHGPYAASFTKLVPEHQVAMLMGQTVRVRADPAKLTDVILEE
jgi:hypothetical protein